jgi:hypothetical protein
MPIVHRLPSDIAAPARIVPAPERVMTDAEAREWFKPYGPSGLIDFAGGEWRCDINGLQGSYATGATIEDAIRAARRKLEG